MVSVLLLQNIGFKLTVTFMRVMACYLLAAGSTPLVGSSRTTTLLPPGEEGNSGRQERVVDLEHLVELVDLEHLVELSDLVKMIDLIELIDLVGLMNLVDLW